MKNQLQIKFGYVTLTFVAGFLGLAIGFIFRPALAMEFATGMPLVLGTKTASAPGKEPGSDPWRGAAAWAGASLEKFKEQMSLGYGYVPFREWIMRQPRAALEFENFDGSPQSLQAALDELNKRPWFRDDLDLRMDLAEKSLEMSKDSVYKSRIQDQLNYWRRLQATSFKSDWLSPEDFEVMKLLEMKFNHPNFELYIDGVKVSAIPKSAQWSGKMEKNKDARHWVLLTDVFEPVVVFGSKERFLLESSAATPLALGECGAKLSANPWLGDRYAVFWNENCVEHFPNGSLETNYKKIMEAKNRSWVGPSAFVLSLVAAIYMHDKKLVFQMPF